MQPLATLLWTLVYCACKSTTEGRRFIVLFKLHSIRWFMKMSVWSLARQQSVFQQHHGEKHLPEFYPQDGGESQLALKLRHSHAMYWHWHYYSDNSLHALASPGGPHFSAKGVNDLCPDNSRAYIGWQWRNFVPYLCQLIFAAIL